MVLCIDSMGAKICNLQLSELSLQCQFAECAERKILVCLVNWLVSGLHKYAHSLQSWPQCETAEVNAAVQVLCSAEAKFCSMGHHPSAQCKQGTAVLAAGWGACLQAAPVALGCVHAVRLL